MWTKVGTIALALGVVRLVLGFAPLVPRRGHVAAQGEVDRLDGFLASRRHSTRVFALSLLIVLPLLAWASTNALATQFLSKFDLLGLGFLFVSFALGMALTNARMRKFRSKLQASVLPEPVQPTRPTGRDRWS